MQQHVDLLILDGTLVAMDTAGSILEGGGVAIKGDRIVAVDASDRLREQYRADRTIDARHKVIMPGLVDTYGHAGHSMIGGFYHPIHGWPAGQFYWHVTTDRWWYAEAQLAAVERLRFGVTTGTSILGSTPARLDSPIFAMRNAEAYAKVGIRAVLGVGPPDPFVCHIPEPWSGSFFENGAWVDRSFSHEDAVANSVRVIEEWHNGADGRIRIALAPPYLFGRHIYHPHDQGFEYQPEDIPVMIDKAEEMRDLADRFGVQVHTHIFQGSIDFALEHFGNERVRRLLGPDVVIDHGNGLRPSEVEVVGQTASNVATAPSTGENIWYGYVPIIELLKAGANVSIATDGSAPRFSHDLWKDIARAMWHQWIAHRSQQVLPPGKALRMVTIDAARALGMDDHVGSLEVGKKADVITVDLNQPHLTPETFVPQLLTYYVNGNDVDNVVVDGKLLMDDRRITSVDPQEVMGLAREEAEQAFARFDLEPYQGTGHAFWHGARY